VWFFFNFHTPISFSRTSGTCISNLSQVTIAFFPCQLVFFQSDVSAEHILRTAGLKNHQARLCSSEVRFPSKLRILGLHHPAWRSTVILFSTTHHVFPQSSLPLLAPVLHWVDTVMQPLKTPESMSLYSAKMKMLYLHQRATQDTENWADSHALI